MKKSKWSATYLRALSLLLLISTLSNHSWAAPGDLDLSFDTGSGINGAVRAVVVQSDGKFLIGGEFTTVKGLARTGLARLNGDGSGDGSFLAGIPLPGGEPIRTVHLLALQPDGRAVAAHEPYGLSRFNTNGIPDITFNTNALAVLYSLDDDMTVESINITAVIAQTDGKLLVGGAQYLVRLNSDGTRDSSFNADFFANDPYPHALRFALQSDGKVLVAVSPDSLIRLNANGSMDGTFNGFTNVSGASPSAEITGVATQPDGKVLIGGTFNTVNGVSRVGLARLNSNGSVDMSFNPALSGAQGFVIQSGGKIHLGKARLNADGSLDSTFNFASEFQTFAVTAPVPTLQADGKVVLAGVINTIARYALVRFNTDGTHDASLDTGTQTLFKSGFETFSSIRVQPDGKVLIGGYSFLYRDRAPAFIHGTNIFGTRLNADGGRDLTFTSANFYAYFTNIGPALNPQVYVESWDSALSVATQSDGKVIIAGVTYATYCDDSGCDTISFPFLDRAHADGSRDTNFSGGTNLNASAITAALTLPDDRILVAGSFYLDGMNRCVVRLNANGTLDNTFTRASVSPNEGISSLALQSDGKILIGGGFTTINGASRRNIARLNANGTVDNTFNPGTGPDRAVDAVALQPDGKVLIGGSFTNVSGTPRPRIARLNGYGSLDGSFNAGTAADARISAIAVQPDGNVLIAGDFLTVNGVLRPYVARLYGDFARPALSIARSIESTVLSWPAAFGNFQLQSNTNISASNGWSAVVAARSTNNGFISVSATPAGSDRFFRLSFP
jgi:uncharacterized delta-60 repeat protein